MNDIEDRLSRLLDGAADRAPQVTPGLLAGITERHRRRRARNAAVSAAVAVVMVAGGAGTAVRALGEQDARKPATNVTGTPSPAKEREGEERPQHIEKVWPEAVHRIPAKLPDGRAHYPQLLLDDRTLLVMTGVNDGPRQFLWTYDLKSGTPRRIAEIPPMKGAVAFADDIAAGGGNIVWWTSYKEPGKQRVARIWTVPAGGGRPRTVADIPLENVKKKGHIGEMAVAGTDVVFSHESGGVYRVPLRGGRPEAVPGTEGYRLLQWPWASRHSRQAVHHELLDVQTGQRRDAVVKPGESRLVCGVQRCIGAVMRADGAARSGFVRDRDGSRESELPSRAYFLAEMFRLERFVMRVLPEGVVLHDVNTGTSADLGLRPRKGGGMAIPDGGFDRLMTYAVGKTMYVVDLAAIK
ncbi:hypothetical protein FHS43_003780 [Streptosporangium becharense]|uniref:Uncharacterized protein n=1 Tax=Streptosporangium becharense TaxID=1816182 RepID=A0A7W9IIC1_9ACTN|nr:hypothetical protein [Streptosporangium becharense]MBB2912497.1 hypothetical protein [Streptosporangium becharense]MBB5820673.1 hypothetical protein [Streptosporangium becharense]